MARRISWEDRQPEIYAAYIRNGRNAVLTARELDLDRATVTKYALRHEAALAAQPILDNSEGRSQEIELSAQLAIVREQLARLESQAGALVATPQNQVLEVAGQDEAPVPVTHVYEERPRVSVPHPAIYRPTQFLKCAYVSDVHLPYEDKVNVRLTLDFLADYKPELIILGGDIWDFYEISDYERDAGRVRSLQDEFDEGRYFIRAVADISPNVTVLEGNHEGRLHRLINRNPGLFKLRSLEIPRAAELPEHWRYFPSQTHYRLGPMLALHGDVKGMSDRATHPAYTLFNRLKRSCIAGHFHRFGRYYDTDYDGVPRAGFVNGHLSDVRQVKYLTSPNWQSGFSTIEMAADGHLFRVDQHIIVDGRMIAGGKEYTI